MSTTANELLEYIPQKERDSYDAADFAGPDRSFPITTQAQLNAAAHLIGHAADPAAVKRKAIAIAKRKGFTLPDAWKNDDKEETNPNDLDGELSAGKKQESAATVVSSITKPRQRIATLNVCFLEYNARSLNGRIYPKATCDAIYQSGQRKLADSNALAMTCFISHETANSNANTELVGRVVKLWQEGGKFYAAIDLADTRTAWDMLALAEGGYMRSESMRVAGVELLHDRNYDVPLVVPQEGFEVELMGIDLTTRPGLVDTARIQQVLYESQSQQPFTESFTLDTVHIANKQEAPMSIPLFLRVLLSEHMDPQAHQKIHDHLAGVMDAVYGAQHGSESARLIAAVESELSEEGKAIARQHGLRLAKAHDIGAHHLGMECEGCYNDALGIALSPDRDGPIDPDHDGDVHGKTQESSHLSSQSLKEESMTPEQMMEELKKQGYSIEPPKTKEQELQESFDAKLAEQERKFNERLAALQPAQPPQRQTQSIAGTTQEGDTRFQPEYIYQEGDYLQGSLHPKNWKALSDRRVPWPNDVNPEMALFELAPFLSHRMLEIDAAARGVRINDLVGPNEDL